MNFIKDRIGVMSSATEYLDFQMKWPNAPEMIWGKVTEQSMPGYSPWVKFLAFYMIVQAIIGIMIFESIYRTLAKFQEVNEKRDGKFPQYRRHDAKYWSRWRFYPGAMFIMPTRLIIMISSILFTCLCSKIV